MWAPIVDRSDGAGKLCSFHEADASRLYDRRPLLTRRKTSRLFLIDVDARELFAILINDRCLPMVVLAPAISPLKWLFSHNELSSKFKATGRTRNAQARSPRSQCVTILPIAC